MTTTGYALLGLLALRPWTTYELAQQVRRSLSWFWPRTERKLYDEPKRLVAAGFATAREEFTGKRKRTVYEITDAGRAALRAWLGEPSAPPSMENEAMVRVFFADGGDVASLQVTLAAMADGARVRLAELEAMEGGEYPFPERRHITRLAMRLQQRQEQTMIDWATWASAEVARWDATTSPG
ncbi:PadR family transcriptional regulator [Nocardioides sp. SR21]|uniref:PadR family transcriptional regulator n=1 Tax=Nocardioides sp. SR21 TaxID=2919501 RepID=UPI001FAA3D57|nr:PadR family transcriptional regulator [Nocardioides sp. SR21]